MEKIIMNKTHFQVLIGKYVPVERIGDFKKDLISQTITEEEINHIIKKHQPPKCKVCEEITNKLRGIKNDR
jgi:hypothetical protein